MRRLCFNHLFVYYCMWLIVMLWALIYRWAGSSAEKDIHKMDQFPLGKGKRVWLIRTATASIVLCLCTNIGAGVCALKTYPSHCFPTPQMSLLFYALSTVLSVTFAPFPKHTVELVMGLTVSAKTTQTVIVTCMPFIFILFLQSHIACSKDLLSL